MAQITFIPENAKFEIDDGSKVLAVARAQKVNISYSCGACRCGLCVFDVKGDATLSPMDSDEQAMLEDLEHPTDGTIRLACRTKVMSGHLIADLTRNLE